MLQSCYLCNFRRNSLIPWNCSTFGLMPHLGFTKCKCCWVLNFLHSWEILLRSTRYSATSCWKYDFLLHSEKNIYLLSVSMLYMCLCSSDGWMFCEGEPNWVLMVDKETSARVIWQYSLYYHGVLCHSFSVSNVIMVLDG